MADGFARRCSEFCLYGALSHFSSAHFPSRLVKGVKHRQPVDRFAPIYRALLSNNTSFVIIGGQACALWAQQFDQTNLELRNFYPYVTRDLDLCATTKNDVSAAGNALHVKPQFPRKCAASSELGILKYHLEDGDVFIQILRGGFDVSGKEIIERKQIYRWKEHGLLLEVMHPVLCLQEKAAAVCRREQRGRQDQRHLLMAMQFVPAFIAERIHDSAPLQVLQMCQRILEIAENRHGLTCYAKKRLRIEGAIPIETLAQSARRKLVNFAKEEYLRRFEKLESARQTASRRS
jgi:hypothetical protein